MSLHDYNYSLISIINLGKSSVSLLLPLAEAGVPTQVVRNNLGGRLLPAGHLAYYVTKATALLSCNNLMINDPSKRCGHKINITKNELK